MKKIDLIINRLRVDMVKRGDMLNVDDVCEILSVHLIGVVPDDENVVIAANNGEPLVGTDCMAGKAYENISKRVMGEDIPFIELDSKKGIVSLLMGLFKGK